MSVRLAFIVLLTVVVWPEPTIFAQGSCEAGVLSQMERESKRFAEDVDESARNVVNEELTGAAFAAAKDVLKDNATAQAVLDTREKWNTWKEHVETAKKGLDDVIDCSPNYAFSCLMEQSRQTNAQIRKWLESLAGESAQAIKDKVTKVTGLYRSYVERAFGNAQTSIDSYLNNCTAAAEQRIQTRTSNGGGPKSGIGAGTIVTIAGAAVGGVLGWKYYQDTMAESEALLNEFSNLPFASPTQNTTSPPTGASQYNGTYRATVTRSCTPSGPGVVCVQAPQQGSCSPTAFQFNVSSGVVSDCGPWIGRGTVQTNGSFTGVYLGSSIDGITIRGTFPPNGNGAFTLTGTGTQNGGSYSVTIQVSK